jgi:hypothetical protein
MPFLAGISVAAVIGTILGGAAGYGVHRFVGCRTGACPIWANPWISTLYGAFLGAALAG